MAAAATTTTTTTTTTGRRRGRYTSGRRRRRRWPTVLAWTLAVAAVAWSSAADAGEVTGRTRTTLAPEGAVSARRAAQETNRTIKVTLQLLSGLSTYDNGERTWLGRLSTTKAAAGIIAAQHCQERNSLVVEELGRDAGMRGCDDLEFGVTSWDTRSVQSVAVKSYLAGTTQETNTTNVVIGTSRSLTSLPVSILANVNKIPIMSYWATSPDFDDNSIHEQFLRTIPSDSATATAVADLFQEYDLEYAGMLYVDDTYGDGFREALLVETDSRGITLETFSYREGDSLSIKNAINGLEDTKLNVVFVVAFMADFPAIMDEFKERGMAGRGTLFIFSDAIGADELTQVVQDYPHLASVLNATQVVQAVSGDDRNPVFDRLRKNWPTFRKYTELINSLLPGGDQFSDPTLDLNDDLPDDNLTLTISEDLFTTASVVETYIYDTAFAYDAVVAACRAACMSYASAGFPAITDEPGEPTFDGEDRRPVWLRGDALVSTLRNISSFPFNGASGRVEFDASTGSRVPDTAYFKLRSMIIDADTLVADVWSVGDWNGTWALDASLLFPPGDTHEVPLQTDLPYEDMHHVGTELRGMAIGMVAVVFLLCVLLGVWVWANRRSRVVRKAQPEFLLFFLLGICTAVCSLAAFAYPDGRSDDDKRAGAACNVFVWLLSIGTTVTVSAIILKLYRIMRIFHNPSLRSLLIRASSLLRIMATLLVVNIVLLLVPTIVQPITWKRIVVSTDEFGNPLESYATCYFGNSTTVQVCYWLLLAFHVGLYVVGAAIAYRIRDVDSSFQEGKTLAVATIWQFQLYLVAAPIVLAVSATETEIKFLIICLAIFLANVFAALFVLAPKIHAVRYRPEEDEPKTGRREAFRRGRHPPKNADESQGGPGLGAGASGRGRRPGMGAVPGSPESDSGFSNGPSRGARPGDVVLGDLDSLDDDEDDDEDAAQSIRLHAGSSSLFDTMEQEAVHAHMNQQHSAGQYPESNSSSSGSSSASASNGRSSLVAETPRAPEFRHQEYTRGSKSTITHATQRTLSDGGTRGSEPATLVDERWPSSGSSEAQINVA